MQTDYGHFEEERLDRPTDFRLAGRLFPFVRPYGWLFVVSAVMVVMITGFELSIPYITKLAIDRHIVPRVSETGDDPAATGQRMLAVPLDRPGVRDIVNRRHGWFRIDNGVARIPYADMTRLSADELRVLRRDDLTGAGRLAALLLVVIIANLGVGFVQVFTMELAGQRIMHDIRMRLYSHLQRMRLSYFFRHPVGRLVTRVTNDTQNMNELFTSVVAVVFKDAFLLVGIAAVMVAINARLALVSFSILPVVVVTSLVFSRQSREAFRQLRIKLAEINTRFSETIGGIRVIQLFGQEAANNDNFRRLNHDYYRSGMMQVHVFAVFLPVIEVLGSAALAIVIYYGGGSVLRQAVSLGDLVAFISYMRMFFRPIRDIAEKFNILQNAMASAERIFQILDNPAVEYPRVAVGHAPADGRIAPAPGIRFEKVSFSYEPDRRVLRDIDLTVAGGSTLAIVGPTGSGKTTLINLLMRFYEPDRGRIRFGGQDIQHIDLAELRSHIALVMQDPFLFSDTIRANIWLDDGQRDAADMSRILELARCRDLVDRLPEGLDTVLSEGGRSLSSGERQLISIARALARDPGLIILDEATSYVDSETEARLQAAMENLMADRTAIVVAHRLSTARRADQIVVLHEGRIIERGTHEQLMRRKGFYFQLTTMDH